MMTSFFSAVSGMKAQQTGLNVIANNIANVNTIGYKQQRVVFGDLLSQTISSATGPSDTQGGKNPMQVGLGTSVASIDNIMTVGTPQYTGVGTDIALSGDGFLIVQGGSQDKYQFTRAGNLDVDEAGNLTVNGYQVCGWQSYTVDENGEYVFDTTKDVEPINIYSDEYNGNKKVLEPKASTDASFSGNLSPSASVVSGATLTNIGSTTSLTFDSVSTMTTYDAQGNSYDVKVNWKKCATDSATGNTSWYWELDSADASLGMNPSSGYLAFDSSGSLVTNNTTFNTTPTVTMTPTDPGREAFDVKMDFSDISQYVSSDSKSSVTGEANGYEAGSLQGMGIASDGTIVGTYSNGQSQALGQIALANFDNPEGLEKIGDNLYVTTTNSGNFTGGVVAGSNGTGAMSSSCLEMSNVDLANEFSQMMITQRAYQANSKVISTSDSILESLMNMVR